MYVENLEFQYVRYSNNICQNSILQVVHAFKPLFLYIQIQWQSTPHTQEKVNDKKKSNKTKAQPSNYDICNFEHSRSLT